MQVHDSHTFLAAGLASAIVLAMAAFGLAAWLGYKLYRIGDQVEQVLDAWTPSMAEAMPEAEPEEPEVPFEWKEINGHRIRISTGEQVVAEREVAVPQAARYTREGVQGLQVRRPTAYPTRPVPRATVRD